MPLAQSHYTDLGTLAAQYNLHNQCGLVWEQRTESCDETVAYLKELEEHYPGLEHIMLGFPFGVSAVEFQAQLRRFAREVMPAFRQQAAQV